MVLSELKDKVIKQIRELGKLTPIALVTLMLPIVGSTLLIYFAGSYSDEIHAWISANKTQGFVLYFLGVLLLCGLALLPTNVIGIFGGWAFGFSAGIAVLICGIVASAVFSYMIHLRLTGTKLPELAVKHEKAAAIYHELIKDKWLKTTLIVFLIRSSVVMPFAFTNFLMASARVRLTSYIIGTFGGMLPRSSAVAFLGSGLSEFSFETPTDSWVLIVGAIASFLMVGVIAYLSRRALENLVSNDKTKTA